MPGYLGTITHEEIEAVSLYLLSLEEDLVPLKLLWVVQNSHKHIHITIMG